MIKHVITLSLISFILFMAAVVPVVAQVIVGILAVTFLVLAILVLTGNLSFGYIKDDDGNSEEIK